MELLCPAGSLNSFKAAIDSGADAIYIGFNNQTNARQFAGLNFGPKEIGEAICLAHKNNVKVHIALNTFAHPRSFKQWTNAIDQAVKLKADVLILADLSLLEYAHSVYPKQEIHLSVQASATNLPSIEFYVDHFNVKRVVLPRVLSIAQVKAIVKASPVEVEVFAFGSLCIMAEGRCYLSSYLTGESPNSAGACSPAKYVEWKEEGNLLESRLNNFLIDQYLPNERAGYPTLCKGRFTVGENHFHAMEEPVSLNTLELLPELIQMGVAAIKIEGRQRSPTYVAKVTKVWRQAIDQYHTLGEQNVDKNWQKTLADLSEGAQTTLGAYHRDWQ